MARMRAPERRRQLLETAAKVFARKGYRGATTAELATAAGVTEPVLYQHFKNKRDLFVTLIDEVGAEVISTWEAQLEDVQKPEDRLSILLRANPATHTRGRGVYRVIFHAMTEQETDRRVRSALRRHVSMLRDFVEEELAELQQAGAVRTDETAADLATLLVDVGAGFGMFAALGIPGHAADTGRIAMHDLLEELICA